MTFLQDEVRTWIAYHRTTAPGEGQPGAIPAKYNESCTAIWHRIRGPCEADARQAAPCIWMAAGGNARILDSPSGASISRANTNHFLLHMKNLLAPILVFACANAFSAESPLLQHALSCKLKDSEIPSLMRELAAGQAAFAKPSEQSGAPSADIYRLPKPVSALGYTSAEVVVTPGRILMAVPGESVGKAIGKLKLKAEEYSPASRVVRPSVSVVAFQLSHKTLENKLLVGCEYANPGAASWVR